MASFTDPVHLTKRFRLLTQKKDIAGNVFVYLKGLASTAIGDWVVYDELGVTTRLITTSAGPVGISMAANILSTTFSWYLIDGVALGNAATAYADNATVNGTATPGVVDDDSVATAAEVQIFGAIGRSALSGSQALFQVYRPYKSLAVLD